MSLSKLNELAFQPQPPLSTFDSLTKRLISYVAVVAALGETSSIAREPKLTYRSRTLLALCLALFAFLGAFHPSRAAAASNNLILDGSFEEAPCTTTFDGITAPERWAVGGEIPDWTAKPSEASLILVSYNNWGHFPACFGKPNAYFHFGPTPYGNQFIALGYVYPFQPVSLLQTIKNLTPGGTYKLSFAIASQFGCCAFAQVSFPSGSKTLPQLFEAPAGNALSYLVDTWAHWGTEHMTFVATKSSVTVDFTDALPYSIESMTANGGGLLALDNVVVTPGTQLRLNATSGSDTESKDVGSAPVSATFPLGAKFSFTLKNKSDGTAVQSTYALKNPSIQPAITKPALFPKNAVLEFDASTASDTKHFRAVHMGKETLTITPSDGSLSPVTVNITVNKPTSLGSSHNQYDSELIKYANKRGIPPQYLKGQVEHESSFDPNAFRYEPLSWDLKYVSVKISGLRDKFPYLYYILATTDGYQEGPYITDADISPRDKYYFQTTTGFCRFLTNQDTLVSAYNIYTNNDLVPKECRVDDPGHALNQNWTLENLKEAMRVALNPSLMNFTAQTTIASSYGLLQVMYPTAISTMHWSGEDGAQNPSYLFDTPTNLANGGGSLPLGAGYLVLAYKRLHPNLSDYSSERKFADAFKVAFDRYNNCYSENEKKCPYGVDVILDSKAFAPKPTTTIFQ